MTFSVIPITEISDIPKFFGMQKLTTCRNHRFCFDMEDMICHKIEHFCSILFIYSINIGIIFPIYRYRKFLIPNVPIRCNNYPRSRLQIKTSLHTRNIHACNEHLRVLTTLKKPP